MIIGAGPAGLCNALHAANKGIKTAVFEAGYAGQTWSDAFMQPVKEQRTNRLQNSLVNASSHDSMQTGLSLEDFDQHLCNLPNSSSRGSELITRERVFDYFSHVTRAINNSPDVLSDDYRDQLHPGLKLPSMLVEQAKVKTVDRRPDGLFEVKVRLSSGQTITQVTKNIMMSVGNVGIHGEKAKAPNILKTLAKESEHVSLVSNNSPQSVERLRKVSKKKRAFIVSDQVLGNPTLQKHLSQQKNKDNNIVIGQGQSAGNAVLELADQSPATVTWFIKDRDLLEKNQLQIPTSAVDASLIRDTAKDPSRADRLNQEYLNFGTPITPAFVDRIEALEQQGRVQIVELGGYFEDSNTSSNGKVNSISYSDFSGFTIHHSIKDSRHPDVTFSNPGGVIVSAIGYSKEPTILEQQLIDKGMLEMRQTSSKITNGSPNIGAYYQSKKEPHLYITGARSTVQPANSAVPGQAHISVETIGHIYDQLLNG